MAIAEKVQDTASKVQGSVQDTAEKVQTAVKGATQDAAEKVKGAVKSVEQNTDHKEGPVAKAIEEQTAKLPSDLFLWAAIGSMGVSAALQLTQKKNASHFVGQWVAPFLLLGVYNKIVKVAGSDHQTK